MIMWQDKYLIYLGHNENSYLEGSIKDIRTYVHMDTVMFIWSMIIYFILSIISIINMNICTFHATDK